MALNHCQAGADWDPIIAPVCYQGARCTCHCNGCIAAKARGEETVPLEVEKERKPNWIKRLVPLCPFDRRELDLIKYPSLSILHCKSCERQWELSKQELAKMSTK